MPRASALPADERRAQILAAADPLLRQLGRAVSTRQIAQAAGVAEGTIFRVFDDKAELIGQAVMRSVSAEPTVTQLQQIDADLDLETKLVQITVVLQQRLRHTFGLLQALGPPPGATHEGRREFSRHMDEQNRLVTAAVAQVIDSDQDALVLTTDQTVQLLATLTLGVSHPMFAHTGIVHLSDDPEAVVDLVLRGALADGASTARRFAHREADPSPSPRPEPQNGEDRPC